jgi:phosphatidylglycerol:prolipoprotein diacylglycerol transferase
VKPTLFHLGSGPHPVEVHSYGLFIAFGLLLGVALAVRRGQRVGIETGATLDLTFYAVVFGMLGARLLYVLMHAGQYVRLCAGTGTPRSFGQRLSDCTAALHIWQGGLVFLGGGVLAACATLVIARRKRLGLGLVADVLAPSVSIAHVFGRLGCFMVGCCYGKPWPGGVHFPRDSVAFDELLERGMLQREAPYTYGLHPTQIYEAAGELLIFLLLLRIWRRRPLPGMVALAYAFGYGLLRFVVEIFRGDETRGFLFRMRIPGLAHALALPRSEPLFLSTAQATALLLMVFGALGYGVLRRRHLKATSQPGPLP